MKTPTQQIEQYYDRARKAYAQYENALKSMSGSDVADSEIFRLERLFWIALSQDVSIDQAFITFNREWRQYAKYNNAKVEEAPKQKYGPCSGQSVISHRWVSPELAETKMIHMRHMAQLIDHRPLTIFLRTKC